MSISILIVYLFMRNASRATFILYFFPRKIPRLIFIWLSITGQLNHFSVRYLYIYIKAKVFFLLFVNPFIFFVLLFQGVLWHISLSLAQPDKRHVFFFKKFIYRSVCAFVCEAFSSYTSPLDRSTTFMFFFFFFFLWVRTPSDRASNVINK